MLCEFCKENEATVHLKQVCNGDVKEIDICVDCAEERGFDVQSPLAMTDFLFGMGNVGNVEKRVEEKACPNCHMRPSDFKKASRLGCPACYEAFAEELSPMLSGMHNGARHVGKVLAREKVSLDLTKLRDELDRCVSQQDFEQAAVLRDKIKSLSGGGTVTAQGSV
jgi:protein arginine kinase activator